MEDHPKKNLKSDSKNSSHQKSSKKSEKNTKNNPSFFSKISDFKQNIFSRKNTTSSLHDCINKTLLNCESEGLIASEEKRMIKNLFNISEVKVVDVMIPRADIIAVKQNSSLEQIRDSILVNEHTRIPVYKDNLDEIIGFIHSKDLVKFLGTDNNNFKINNLIRKILFVPQSMRIVDLLLKMRSSRLHIAIVLDEYGGTDGLITIEDIMEEIVGEIEDEHDIPHDNIYLRIKKINDNTMQVGGRVAIEKIEEILGKKITPENEEEREFNTIGGMILSTLKRIPEIDETIKHESGLLFKIIDADARSVKLVEVTTQS